MPEESKTVRHALVPEGPPAIITSDPDLADLIAQLRESGSFAYDSEFIGELTYFPKLCVIQVASSSRVALIDPLAKIDLRPFWELIADPSVEKVVHAGQQDLEPIVRHLDRQPANVFDTQIVAGFVGLPYPVALSRLVQELTGARLGKGLTFTHWDQRPLSPMQVRYAADDVRFLPLVRDELGKRLHANNHTAWATEECDALCDASQYRFDPATQYLRVRGAASLQPRNLAVLRELTIWRDATARHHDVPPRAFLKDEILIDLSRNPVKSVEKLERVRGLPRPVEQEYGNDIVEATRRAMSLPGPQLPEQREAEQSPTERFRADGLWALAQCLCAGQSIDPAILTSRQEMADFYRPLSTRQDVSQSRLMKGWRRAALGEPLSRLVDGSGDLNLRWEKGSLRVVDAPARQ